MERKEKEDVKIREEGIQKREEYEKPQVTTYSEEDILSKYEVCAFSF